MKDNYLNIESVEDLKNVIDSVAVAYMKENCVLLNTPDHRNIGDQLIRKGEIDFLSNLNIQPRYIASEITFDWRELPKDTLILLHGGGNFGDVWELHQDFRIKVIEKYNKNKIFIFPQTVQYNSKSRLLSDAEAFSKNKNVTICARDKRSFQILSEYFKNEILLLPDMAFSSTYMVNDNIVKKDKNLFLQRKDRELSKKINNISLEKFEICDWPTFDNNFRNISNIALEKANRVISKFYYNKISKDINEDTTFGLFKIRNYNEMIDRGVDYLSAYKLVATTRLHGHILSLLLGIPSIMIDNNYGKNSSFYDTWLKNIPNSKCVNSQEAFEREVQNLIR